MRYNTDNPKMKIELFSFYYKIHLKTSFPGGWFILFSSKIFYVDTKTELLTLILECSCKNDVIKYVIKVNLWIIDNHRYL